MAFEEEVEEEVGEPSSIMLTPVTPHFVNEDSMGFNGLNALNIITPGPPLLDSTQGYLDLVKDKISPPRPRDTLNSTQCYYDLVRGEQTRNVRRRLFVEGDEMKRGMTELLMVAQGLKDEGEELEEGFEEDFAKTELLKRDVEEDVIVPECTSICKVEQPSTTTRCEHMTSFALQIFCPISDLPFGTRF